MEFFTHHPIWLFLAAFLVLWLACLAGTWLRPRDADAEAKKDDLAILLGATLTLLALIIGFSFSMAIGRYDQRKNYEEAEANAIGTEYLRADVLPAANAEAARRLLRLYTDERIKFYVLEDESVRAKNDARTAQTQNNLWAAVRAPANGEPTPITALAVAGMNDVINSQGYSQAAAWNRIPVAAWGFMMAIALCCTVLFGYGSRDVQAARQLAFMLPLIISIAFLLIADIDAPIHGLIHVTPQNLRALAQSLRPPPAASNPGG